MEGTQWLPCQGGWHVFYGPFGDRHRCVGLVSCSLPCPLFLAPPCPPVAAVTSAEFRSRWTPPPESVDRGSLSLRRAFRESDPPPLSASHPAQWHPPRHPSGRIFLGSRQLQLSRSRRRAIAFRNQDGYANRDALRVLSAVVRLPSGLLRIV